MSVKIHKKKCRFFETYLTRVLKEVSSETGITQNSRQQFNSFLKTFATYISNITYTITKLAKKHTISSKEVLNAIQTFVPDKIRDDILDYCELAIIHFEKDQQKGSSRQNKAGIIFPPSIAEKYLRGFGYNKIMITHTAPICLASILEYITTRVFKHASVIVTSNKRARITIRDLELAVGNDTEIKQIFHTNKFSFLGGGVIPYIHPSLLSKKRRKSEPIKNSTKKYRHRHGTISLKEIKKYQKMSNCLTLAKLPFERVVRDVFNNNTGENNTIKISKDVFIILQYFIEQYTVNFLEKSNAAAIHAGRVKLMPVDINFIVKTMNFSIYPDERETYEEGDDTDTESNITNEDQSDEDQSDEDQSE